MPAARSIQRWGAASALFGGAYFLALLFLSLTSEERVLGPGTPKHFCGFYLDCHRLVTLVRVERTDVIGAVRAQGVFHVVTVRLASDAKRANLRTGRLTAVVRDDLGRVVARALEAERALDPDRLVGLPDIALAPGGAVTTRLVFELPRDAAHPRLHVRDSAPLAVLTEMVLLGDEDSFLHARTTFALDDARQALIRPPATPGPRLVSG